MQGGGFAWLPKGQDQDRFVVFDVRDISALLPAVQAAASGADVVFLGGSLDGQVWWFRELPTQASNNDEILDARETYVPTGDVTAEGYHVFRVGPRP